MLNNGTVEAIGNHEELKNYGLYSKLWNLQGELEAEFNKILNEGGSNDGR